MRTVASACRLAMTATALIACNRPGPARHTDSTSATSPAPSSVIPVVARYRLIGVDTVGLPDSTSCGAMIATAGELALHEDQRWTARERAHYDCARRAAVVVDSGTFQWRGDTLTLVKAADPAAPGIGLRRGDTLFVDFGVDAVYIYARRP